MEVVVTPSVPRFVRGTRPAGLLDLRNGSLAVPLSPSVGGDPAALPAVRRYYGPSGHPMAFVAVADDYLAPRSFSSGPMGLLQSPV